MTVEVLFNPLLGGTKGSSYISQEHKSKRQYNMQLKFELAYYDVKVQHVNLPHKRLSNSFIVKQ